MRFYAGHPLRTKDGLNVGTICLIDDTPRAEFTAREKSELKELARMVLRELESRQHEVRLLFTGISNHLTYYRGNQLLVTKCNPR
jgi:GAF domain-containing protein